MYSKLIKRSRVKIPGEEVLQLYRNARPELYSHDISKLIKDSLPLSLLSRYPDVESFLDKLSTFIGIPKNNIMLSSGIDGAIKAVFESFSSKDSKVAILTPTYKMYEVYASMFEVKLTQISSDKKLSINIDSILNIIPEMDIIFLPNPHEPVENVFTREELERIIKEAAIYDTLIIVDEAYYYFGAPTVIDLSLKYPNLLVMRTFSKGFGLPAIRLGYTTGSPNLISILTSRRLAYETNSLTIWVAMWAINNFEIFKNYINEVIDQRTFLKYYLNKLGFDAHGSFSNTILIDFKSSERALEIHGKLESSGVWTRELTEFPYLGNWVSVTVGNEQTTNTFIEKLKEVLND